MMLTDTARAQFRNLRRGILHKWAKLSHQRYFILLGLLLSLVATIIIVGGYWSTFERKTFDFLMKARLHAPAPDPSIVIINIDERSLAEMAAEYGRWPWPRRVLGELIEHVHAQKPRAIVLDILIADPDLQNPDSEMAFDAVVRKTPDVFYSSIRLPSRFDGASALTVDRVPGVSPPAVPDQAPRVAMLLPYLDSILATGRVGIVNLLPDRDGVAREAWLYQDIEGWRIPSLPAAVAKHMGKRVPDGDRILLNWRGPPSAYLNVSFSDVYRDSLIQKPERPRDEFRGKIVMIGSSATGLFDLRPTPVSTITPGTEILATALDNIIRNDPVWRPPIWLAVLMSTGVVMALALTFAFDHHEGLDDRSFFILQAFIGVTAFAVLHFAPVYVDASAPITFGTLYFGLARLSVASRSLADSVLLRERVALFSHTAHVFWVRAQAASGKDFLSITHLFSKAAKHSRLSVARLSPPTDSLAVLAEAFDHELGLVWFVAPGADDEKLALAEIDQLAAQIDALARSRSLRLNHSQSSHLIPHAGEPRHSYMLKSVFGEMFSTFNSTPQESPDEK